MLLQHLTLSVPSVAKGKSNKNSQISFCKILEQIALFESTCRDVSFEWSHHRILSTDSKVSTTLTDSNIHSGSERVFNAMN